MATAGSLSDLRDASNEDQQLANDLRSKIEAQANKTYTTFVAVKHGAQVVAGINHFIKIQVDNNEFLHAKIYEDFQGRSSLVSVQFHKSATDALVYF